MHFFFKGDRLTLPYSLQLCEEHGVPVCSPFCHSMFPHGAIVTALRSTSFLVGALCGVCFSLCSYLHISCIIKTTTIHLCVLFEGIEVIF